MTLETVLKSLFFGLVFFVVQSSYSQAPLVKMWDYRFGGTSEDWITCVQETRDGGFILGGYSNSDIGGDKTENVWGNWSQNDYWVVKIDSLGIKQWDRVFGGFHEEKLFALQQTTDGGYILGGYSCSDNTGNKTTVNWYMNLPDFWIVKIDSLGNYQWDKDFGGTSDDFLYSLQQTFDGGFILGGYSHSQANGDKTQPLRGSFDYWILKTDSLGNKLWDKAFGGTDTDRFYSIQQTTEGGYILGGDSRSGTGGDKTDSSRGAEDYWVIKTDSNGIMEWDRGFGGTDIDYFNRLQQTSDEGYILGGASYSGIGGDKSQPTWGWADYWIVKIDSDGVKQWDKNFGGMSEEEIGCVMQTSDYGFLISGDSYSTIGGDKSEGYMGPEQTWIVKTDSLGNKIWDKTIFTTGHDESGLAIESSGKCYSMVNKSYGVMGYKTQPSWNNSYDYWIVKFCEVPVINFISPNTSICPGSCTEFISLTTNATNYSWYFAGASPDISTAENPANICYPTAGTYDVTLIASNANGSDTLTLSNFITVFAISVQSIHQIGDTLFSLSDFISYQWFFNGDNIPGATNYFFLAPQSGDYSVISIDSNGCSSEAVVLNVIAAVSNVAENNPGIFIFPNPASDEIEIRFAFSAVRKGQSLVTCSLLNSLGELKKSEHCILEDNRCLVDVRSLAPGVYFVELLSGEKVFRTKFIKQ